MTITDTLDSIVENGVEISGKNGHIDMKERFMRQKTYRLKVDISVREQFLDEFFYDLGQNGISDKDGGFRIAVSELIENIARCSYNHSPDKEIVIECLYGSRFMTLLADSQGNIDIDKAKENIAFNRAIAKGEITLEEAGLKENGRGFYFMCEFSDRMYIKNRSGTVRQALVKLYDNQVHA